MFNIAKLMDSVKIAASTRFFSSFTSMPKRPTMEQINFNRSETNPFLSPAAQKIMLTGFVFLAGYSMTKQLNADPLMERRLLRTMNRNEMIKEQLGEHVYFETDLVQTKGVSGLAVHRAHCRGTKGKKELQQSIKGSAMIDFKMSRKKSKWIVFSYALYRKGEEPIKFNEPKKWKEQSEDDTNLEHLII